MLARIAIFIRGLWRKVNFARLRSAALALEDHLWSEAVRLEALAEKAEDEAPALLAKAEELRAQAEAIYKTLLVLRDAGLLKF